MPHKIGPLSNIDVLETTLKLPSQIKISYLDFTTELVIFQNILKKLITPFKNQLVRIDFILDRLISKQLSIDLQHFSKFSLSFRKKNMISWKCFYRQAILSTNSWISIWCLLEPNNHSHSREQDRIYKKTLKL